MRLLSIACFALLIYACYMPWIIIPGQTDLVITGMKAESINYGKPGILHIAFASISIVLLLIGRLWSLRTAFFAGAFNLAWAARNYLSLGSCSGGNCPVKQTGLYLVAILSLFGIVCLLFIRKENKLAAKA